MLFISAVLFMQINVLSRKTTGKTIPNDFFGDLISIYTFVLLVLHHLSSCLLSQLIYSFAREELTI